jgi:outer membrane protein OmpA-like peptidoglycan-associated protein
LNGTITDIGTGVPLSSNIYLNESKSGNQAASTNSLTDGLYEIKLIPGIKYDIVVRAEGYSPETKSLIIPKSSSKQEFTYNFSLSKLNEINSKNNSLSTFVNKVIEPSENQIDNNMEALYTNKNQQQNDLEEYVTTKPIMSFGGKDLEVNPLFINLNAPFNYGTATVNPILYPQLDSLISMMKNDESMRIQIGGHTDNVGSSSYNKYLSQLRADAVKIYLIEKGQFQNYRIKSKGFGLDQPIDTNESDQGRTNNRRVEIKLLKNKLIKKFKLTSK